MFSHCSRPDCAIEQACPTSISHSKPSATSSSTASRSRSDATSAGNSGSSTTPERRSAIGAAPAPASALGTSCPAAKCATASHCRRSVGAVLGPDPGRACAPGYRNGGEAAALLRRRSPPYPAAGRTDLRPLQLCRHPAPGRSCVLDLQAPCATLTRRYQLCWRVRRGRTRRYLAGQERSAASQSRASDRLREVHLRHTAMIVRIVPHGVV